MKTFQQLIKSKRGIAKEELNLFFNNLDPIKPHELKGFWNGGFFSTGSKMEFFLKDFRITRWIGKIFIPEKKVKALIYHTLGLKFNIPFLGSATIEEINFRGKKSVAIKYDHLPIVDYLRKIDSKTIMGIMKMNDKTKVYFYLKK